MFEEVTEPFALSRQFPVFLSAVRQTTNLPSQIFLKFFTFT